MDNMKFILLSAVTILLVGLLGYWAIASMQSGTEHVSAQKIRELASENEALKQEAEKLKAELGSPSEVAKEETPALPPTKEPEPAKPTTPEKKPAPTVYKNQTLINELQKLADKGVVLKLKSASPAVGSVQKFLNLYNKTKNKIDNDYGKSTKDAVAAFQKAQGLSATGEAGKTTFLKMVAWLKKQG